MELAATPETEQIISSPQYTITTSMIDVVYGFVIRPAKSAQAYTYKKL